MPKTTKSQTKKTAKGGPTGKKLMSEMIRVDAGFAVWVREQADREGISVTDFTRGLPVLVEQVLA